MRAPGGAVGMYAIECAMDELSYAVGIDPLELRLKNYAHILILTSFSPGFIPQKVLKRLLSYN